MAEKPDAAITVLLPAADRGQPQAAEQLLPLVYDHLRRVAQSLMANPQARPQNGAK